MDTLKAYQVSDSTPGPKNPTNTNVSVHILMGALSKSVFMKALDGATPYSAQRLSVRPLITVYLTVVAQC